MCRSSGVTMVTCPRRYLRTHGGNRLSIDGNRCCSWLEKNWLMQTQQWSELMSSRFGHLPQTLASNSRRAAG